MGGSPGSGFAAQHTPTHRAAAVPLRDTVMLRVPAMILAVDRRYRKIYAAIAAIPPGRVASYGAIAARAGLPGRARLVGTALRETPDGLELPWFRVLHADGTIALPRGSRGFREQARRLRAEGIEVRNGRVPMSAFGLDADLDRALWGLP